MPPEGGDLHLPNTTPCGALPPARVEAGSKGRDGRTASPGFAQPDRPGGRNGTGEAVTPALSAEFADELGAARRRVSVLEEANRAIQESMDRVTRLANFSEGLGRSVSIDEVARLLFEEERGILPQQVMLLALVDADGRDVRPIRIEPADMTAVAHQELTAQVTSGVFGWAIGQRRPTMVPGARLGAQVLLVPLATARRTVGMLMVGTSLSVEAMEQRHLTLTAVVARQAAECIDNIWLAEDIRRRNEAGRMAAEAAAARRVADLSLLVETASALSAGSEREAALRFLVEATCRHLEVTTVTISIVESDGRLVTAYGAGLRSPDTELPPCTAEPQCPLHWVATHRSSLAIPRTHDDPRGRDCAVLRAAGAVSFLGVPLVARNRTIGVLSAMTDAVREFSAEEVALLTGLGAQGATAIENARLFSDVQNRMEQQQRALARLAQSAHLASVGLLAGGIAHDLNNPLCIISNHLQLLRLRPESFPKDIEAAIASMENGVSRMAASIEALLEYARVRPGEGQPTDLNEVIRRILALMQYHPRCRRLDIRTEWGADLPVVQLERAAWEQVVLELITNAREAMADGGRVHIRTRPLDARPAGRGGSVRWAEVVVEDEGRGIAPEDLSRIFDPFFTTKAAKRGMGIGLKICRDVVHAHGGALRIEGRTGIGTRVVIELPGMRDGARESDGDVPRAHAK